VIQFKFSCIDKRLFAAAAIGENIPLVQDCSAITRQAVSVDSRPVIEDQVKRENCCWYYASNGFEAFSARPM
jgi:hypothetical protein